MLPRLPLLLLILLSVMILAACSGQPAPAVETKSDQPVVKSSQTEQKTDAVVFYYEENAQVELISPQGTRVLIDIANPTQLSASPTAADVLLTTHSHNDHLNANFVKTFPGQQLNQKEGALEVAGVKIKGVKSAHNGATPNGSDYIFVIEMGGLRIGHFGDCGQSKLTQAQLDQIGQLDVMITQLENSYSAVSLENKIAFTLIDQLKPKLIIPTHSTPDAIKYSTSKWPKAYVGTGKILINPERLTDTTQFLALGDSITAMAYKKVYQMAEW